MLIFDFTAVGGRLYSARRSLGLTQAEAAERAGISDRAYADMERGTVNMRVETLLRVCEALYLTPDELLTEREQPDLSEEEIMARLRGCTPRQRETALRLLDVYLRSLP